MQVVYKELALDEVKSKVTKREFDEWKENWLPIVLLFRRIGICRKILVVYRKTTFVSEILVNKYN